MKNLILMLFLCSGLSVLAGKKHKDTYLVFPRPMAVHDGLEVPALLVENCDPLYNFPRLIVKYLSKKNKSYARYQTFPPTNKTQKYHKLELEILDLLIKESKFFQGKKMMAFRGELVDEGGAKIASFLLVESVSSSAWTASGGFGQDRNPLSVKNSRHYVASKENATDEAQYQRELVDCQMMNSLAEKAAKKIEDWLKAPGAEDLLGDKDAAKKIRDMLKDGSWPPATEEKQ